jgi:uncharacterized protein
MDLENSFAVPADVCTTWQALLDVETVAACMPGVTVTRGQDGTFTGIVKVKLGPATLTYQGQGRFVSAEEATHCAVVEAAGLEQRGSGTAGATVTIRVREEGETCSRVEVLTSVAVTGRAEQFGRSVLADAAKRLIDQFAGNLGQVVGGHRVTA